MKAQFDKERLHTKRQKTLMNQCYCFVWSSLLIMSLLVACSPSNHTEFSAPFELSSFLKNHIQKLPGQIVEFQILEQDGEPIAYGLLRFEWIEGGRMDFQTDQDGTLSMQFEKDMLENEVIVSSKLEGAKIKVTW